MTFDLAILHAGSSRTDVLSVCTQSVCNVGVLWPNGWMDQDANWYGCRPRPIGDIVLDGDPAPHGKGHSNPSPLFGPLCSGTVAHLSSC